MNKFPLRRRDMSVLTARAVLGIALLILTCAAFAQSKITGVPSVNNPPTEKKSEQASKDKQNAEGQKDTTVQLPSAINVTVSGKLEAPAPQTQSENNGQKRNWWESFFFDFKITDALLVLFSGLLWFATSGLRKSTDGLWQSARDQATDAKAYIAIAKQS